MASSDADLRQAIQEARADGLHNRRQIREYLRGRGLSVSNRNLGALMGGVTAGGKLREASVFTRARLGRIRKDVALDAQRSTHVSYGKSRYTYVVEIRFKEHGAKATLKGTYTITSSAALSKSEAIERAYARFQARYLNQGMRILSAVVHAALFNPLA